MKRFSKIIEAVDAKQYTDLMDTIKEMIEKSLKTADVKTIDAFVKAYIQDSESTKIEGLINDSDVYEFYLAHRNDIDGILSDIKFYNEVPSEIQCNSLYDYIVKGTNRAVEDLVKQMG